MTLIACNCNHQIQKIVRLTLFCAFDPYFPEVNKGFEIRGLNALASASVRTFRMGVVRVLNDYVAGWAIKWNLLRNSVACKKTKIVRTLLGNILGPNFVLFRLAPKNGIQQKKPRIFETSFAHPNPHCCIIWVNQIQSVQKVTISRIMNAKGQVPRNNWWMSNLS